MGGNSNILSEEEKVMLYVKKLRIDLNLNKNKLKKCTEGYENLLDNLLQGIIYLNVFLNFKEIVCIQI